MRARFWLPLLLVILACAGRPVREPAPPPLPVIVFPARAAAGGPRTIGLVIHSAWDAPVDLRGRRPELVATAALLGGSGPVWFFSGPGRSSGLAMGDALSPGALWLFEGTPAQGLHANVTFLRPSPAGEGTPVQPATRAALEAWFAAARAAVVPGDTVVIATTGPGDGRSTDPFQHGLPLWGQPDRLTVRDLAALVGGLPPGVRVVLRASHCGAAGFARLPALLPGPEQGLACGAVAVPDPQAEGCPSETGADGRQVGHARAVDEGLAGGLSVGEASLRALAADDLDEVPLTTSQAHRWDRLVAAARRDGRDPIGLADELLAEAPPTEEPLVAALQAVAARAGVEVPRLLRDLEEPTRRLGDLSDSARAVEEAWTGAFADLTRANLRRLIAARRQFEVLDDRKALEKMTLAGRQGLLREGLLALGAQLRADGERGRRLQALADRRRQAREAMARIDGRLGAMARLRWLLRAAAGEAYLRRAGTAGERAADEGLRACEAWRLPGMVPAALPAVTPWPSLDDDWQAVRALTPARVGVGVEEASWGTRRLRGLPAGTMLVRRVLPEAPGWIAGLRPDDLIAGFEGVGLSEPAELTAWLRLAGGQTLALDVIRSSGRVVVPVQPTQDQASLPARSPPRPGRKAPRPAGVPCSGDVPVLPGDGRLLLFFWGPDCPGCTQALAAVEETARQRGATPLVLAREAAEPVQAALARTGARGPVSLLCRAGRTFRAYGAQAPSFVLVGGDRRVIERSDQYLPGAPIFPDWR